jgi:branched-chain amino acid transport system permease protein
VELHLTLIINGLATGMLIFLLAAGLSLIFGLMSVLNFAHGALFMWGAYVGTSVYIYLGGWDSGSPAFSFFIGILAAITIGIILGYIVERFTIRPVYGNHLLQILITMGVLLVLGELVKVIWGANQITVFEPPVISGYWEWMNVRFTHYRLFIIAFGFLVLAIMMLLLKKSKIGLIVRAGVQNKEMVQALGINVRKVFTFVFIFGTALACVGGFLWGPFQGQVNPGMGFEKMLVAFIVVAIGGMGSVMGSALAAVLVGLSEAYMAYYFPPGSLAVNMIIMALVLLLKPSGLFGATR